MPLPLALRVPAPALVLGARRRATATLTTTLRLRLLPLLRVGWDMDPLGRRLRRRPSVILAPLPSRRSRSPPLPQSPLPHRFVACCLSRSTGVSLACVRVGCCDGGCRVQARSDAQGRGTGGPRHGRPRTCSGESFTTRSFLHPQLPNVGSGALQRPDRFKPSFAVPEGMFLVCTAVISASLQSVKRRQELTCCFLLQPENAAEHALIEKTAQFVRGNGGQAEILLKAST